MTDIGVVTNKDIFDVNLDIQLDGAYIELDFGRFIFKVEGNDLFAGYRDLKAHKKSLVIKEVKQWPSDVQAEFVKVLVAKLFLAKLASDRVPVLEQRIAVLEKERELR